jgi:hypothetical protein
MITGCEFCTWSPSPPRSSLRNGSCRNRENEKSFYVAAIVKSLYPFFSSLSSLSLSAVAHGKYFSRIINSTSALMSRYGHYSGTLLGQGLSLPHPRLNTRCTRSHGLAQAGGFRWRWALPSPTTFYPCGFRSPSPDALCVFRRLVEGPAEAPPSIRRRAAQARIFRGSPPPAPQPRCDAAWPTRLPLFEHRPRG